MFVNMKRNIYIAGICAGMLLFTACGGAKDGLDAKQAELIKLKTEYKTLGDNIRKLEAELSDLDTNQVAKVSRVPVKVLALEPATFQHFVNVQGAIKSDNNVGVGPEMPGTYLRILVEEGDYVKRGQLLARLDDAVIRKGMDELQVQLDLATILYEKQQRLWKQQIGSEVQLLQAKAQRDALTKRLATTREQQALTRIKSPISGVVDAVRAKRGEAAMPGFPGFQIVNLSELSFNADISEAYIPYIKRGDKVSIEFPSVGQALDAKVSSVSQTINPQNRTVTVKVDLPGRHEMLKANMVGEISINDANHENSIVISQQFLQKSGSGSFVMVAEKNGNDEYVAHKQAVKSGMTYQGKVEILEGLNRGHLLITDGYLALSEGQLVHFTGVSNAK